RLLLGKVTLLTEASCKWASSPDSCTASTVSSAPGRLKVSDTPRVLRSLESLTSVSMAYDWILGSSGAGAAALWAKAAPDRLAHRAPRASTARVVDAREWVQCMVLSPRVVMVF